MAWTKVKTVTVCGVGILLAVGTTAVVVKEINEPTAPVIRITGKGQIELFGGAGKSRVVETANLVIETDGKAYRMSVDSTGHNNLTNGVYDVRAEYGSDGRDFFELSDRLSPLHRTHAGFGGFAHPGRFPYTDEAPPSVVHAAWLAYCSRDYFNQSSNHTGFQLVGEFSGFWPAFVTNLPTYWPDSTLPQKMIGWSRNWWIPPRTDSFQPLQAVELKQYRKKESTDADTALKWLLINLAQLTR